MKTLLNILVNTPQVVIDQDPDPIETNCMFI